LHGNTSARGLIPINAAELATDACVCL
jgi:hypothetical protein